MVMSKFVLVFVLQLLQLRHAEFAVELFKEVDHNGDSLPWKDYLSEKTRIILHKSTTGAINNGNKVVKKSQKNEIISSLDIGPRPENERSLSVDLPFKTNMISAPLSIQTLSESISTAADESQNYMPDSSSTEDLEWIIAMESIQSSTTESESTTTMESIQSSTTESESTTTMESIQSSTTESESTTTMESIQSSTPDSESTTTMESIQSSTPDSVSTTTMESIQSSTTESESTTTMKSIQSSKPDSESTTTMESIENSTPDSESITTTESPQTSKPDSDERDKNTFWNPWLISLVSLGAFLTLSIIVMSAYHIGKIRTRDKNGYPPLEIEPQKIIPRVRGFRNPLPSF